LTTRKHKPGAPSTFTIRPIQRFQNPSPAPLPTSPRSNPLNPSFKRPAIHSNPPNMVQTGSTPLDSDSISHFQPNPIQSIATIMPFKDKINHPIDQVAHCGSSHHSIQPQKPSPAPVQNKKSRPAACFHHFPPPALVRQAELTTQCPVRKTGFPLPSV
jgi:hypothetical protein